MSESTELADRFFTQILSRVKHSRAFQTALDEGVLTEEAEAEIRDAFKESLETNEQMRTAFLEDPEFRNSVTRYMLAKNLAEIHYKDTFRSVMENT